MEFTRYLSYRFPLIRGEDVRAVQQALITLQIKPPCGVADGIFGSATEATVLGFQKYFNSQIISDEDNLTEDGIVGPKTWAALFRSTGNTNVIAANILAARKALPEIPKNFSYTAKTPPPLNQNQCLRVKTWLMNNFGPEITKAISGKAYDVDIVCAIACKETAIEWLAWIDKMPPEQILARCVFDASGDYPNTTRKAFPINTAAFCARYNKVLTDQLIFEANLTRRLKKFQDKEWVYKGYGIFQYDLQHIVDDLEFFRDKKWYNFSECLKRLITEMDSKLHDAKGNLAEAIRRYNGSGQKAEEYAVHVLQMTEWCRVTLAAA
ncbi:peptidoglycan-binding protein [Methylomonas sp. LW13]|uniref:peptidoglycan-binding domain-containing protein n=1 Tax=unclassified Methylomonas TaxID=2608980 RepID=UPI000689A983|nr:MULTISPECIES: peptidoglycan-binding protein [unclassified Methylomonas]PKD38777.1 hypothetical protein CWO84_17100 [Methylomonas sp. Kb3]QBC29028.1 peptidoglycan-binding protein [Methylomonas sp. LW13]